MNTLIYGTRKQGKSTLALALAVTDHDQVVIFDPRGTYPIFKEYSLDQVHGRLNSYERGIQITRVGPFDTDEVEHAFAVLSETLRERRDISLIIDESHMLQSGWSLDPNLDRWNRQSGSDVSIIQTTHRIVDAHIDSRYHADYVYFFYAYLPRELKTIRENFGDDITVAIPTLKKHQVIQWYRAVGGLPVWIRWDDSSIWYIDLENNNE